MYIYCGSICVLICGRGVDTGVVRGARSSGISMLARKAVIVAGILALVGRGVLGAAITCSAGETL